MGAPPASADSAKVSCNRIRADGGPWVELPEACGVFFPCGLVPAHSPLYKGAIVVFTDFSEQSFICVGNFHFCCPSSTLCVCVFAWGFLVCFWFFFFFENKLKTSRGTRKGFSLCCCLFVWGLGFGFFVCFAFFFNCWKRFV